MTAVSSSWFIASLPFPEETIEIDGGTSVTLVAADRYLRHTTASLSALDHLAARLSAQTGDTYTVTMRRDRRIVIAANVVFDIDFAAGSGAPTWAAALGYGTGYSGSGQNNYVADNISPLLFSPGWCAIPQTIAGKAGYSVDHKKRYKSDDGQRSFTHYLGSETWQDLELDHIVSSRMCLPDSVAIAARGGTFDQFYEQSAKLGYHFFWYPDITEDSASTSAVTWTTGFGPYVLREEFKGRWNERRVAAADVSNRLRLPLHMLAEYS